MVAPSGATLIADITHGTQLFGADCWASGFGVD
jgi:hypothetical protein